MPQKSTIAASKGIDANREPNVESEIRPDLEFAGGAGWPEAHGTDAHSYPRRGPSHTTQPRLLRLKDNCALVGVSRSTIYKTMNRNADPFPRPLKIGSASRWFEKDVHDWVRRLGSNETKGEI